MDKPEPMSDERAMHVIINACDSLNITRVHELGDKTRTICDEAGLLEIARAIEAERDAQWAARLEELVALLSEVASCFTRDDDLPDGLLLRIDAAITKEQP